MKLDQIKALDPKRVIVLDAETTGLKPNAGDEILSLTIMDLEGTVLFDELVKPAKRKSWPEAQEIHGITPAMVKDKQPLKAYRDHLQELWGNIDLVVGYNVEFDSDFLYNSGLALCPHVEEFDVMKEFAPVWGKWDDYHNDYRWAKLAQCAKHYGITLKDAHSSLGDTEATRQCFIALLNDEKYLSSKRAIETMSERNQSSAPSVSTAKPEGDVLDKVLTALMAVLAVFGVVKLFSEWQMTVTCLFAIFFIYLIKLFRRSKKRN